VKRGLVFGKFLPLHRGHQLMIETALSQVDDLTIVVYDSRRPGVERMPVELRLRWLRDLYPDVENILALDDPLADAVDTDDPAYAEVYAAGVAFLGRFDKVFSSEPGYERFAGLLGAEHVLVDEARTLVPTSGTVIRSDPYAYRGWMDPLVYSSLIERVVFVGTESTGKSTLAQRMATELDTLWTHEFGRELWEAQNLEGSFADHLRMARRQRQREDAACRHARRYLFCDTNAWTTLHWSLRSYGTADARLQELVDRTQDDYTWFLCANDFGWIQDGTREMAGAESGKFQEQQIRDLERRGIPYVTVTGPVEQRVEQVRAALAVERALATG
jgi:HTH-type transcriptional regulator, transcriptional repressor of NAD biosynthesis genes